MAQHKMIIVDGVRYREEDVPEGAKGTEDRARVVEDQRTGRASTVTSATSRRSARRAAKADADTSTDSGAAGDAGAEG